MKRVQLSFKVDEDLVNIIDSLASDGSRDRTGQLDFLITRAIGASVVDGNVRVIPPKECESDLESVRSKVSRIVKAR